MVLFLGIVFLVYAPSSISNNYELIPHSHKKSRLHRHCFINQSEKNDVLLYVTYTGKTKNLAYIRSLEIQLLNSYTYRK